MLRRSSSEVRDATPEELQWLRLRLLGSIEFMQVRRISVGMVHLGHDVIPEAG
jgi:hypothetical protein